VVRKLICSIGVAVLLLVVMPPALASSGQSTVISGHIRLPAGETAPEGGMSINITNDLGSTTTTYIPEGATSAPYSLQTTAGQEQNIRYYFHPTDYNGSEYIRQGYYAVSISSARAAQARKLVPSVDGLSGVDLYINRGVTISGTITLPEGYTAPPGGTRVQVGNSDGCWVNVSIPAGETQVDYTLTVNPGAYRIYFDPFGDTRFVRGVYYHPQSSVSVRQESAWVHAVSTPVTGIDAELMSGISISGRVTLSSGVAQAGGQSVILRNQHDQTIRVRIPAGQTSVNYAWVLPANQAYVLQYELDDCKDESLQAMGYFGEREMTISAADATWLWLDKPLEAVDIDIHRRPSISGNLLLPDGMTAPSGGLTVRLRAGTGTWHTTQIPEGQTSVSYSMKVDPGTYNVSYQVSGAIHGLLPLGYYVENQSVASQANAKVFEMRLGDALELDIILARVGQIEGRVYLPDNRVAPASGFPIYLINSRVPDKLVVIPAGRNSAPYVMELLIGDHQTLRYQFPDSFRGETELWHEGYYSPNGTVPMAHYFDVTEERIEGADLHLLMPCTTSGIISLAEDLRAPEGGLAVEAKWGENTVEILIPAGQNSSEYELLVPQGLNAVIFRTDLEGELYSGTSVLPTEGEMGSLNVQLQHVPRYEEQETVQAMLLTTVVNERGYTIDEQFTDFAPVTYKSNDTYMPLRMLEALGATVEWDEYTQTATLQYGEKKE